MFVHCISLSTWDENLGVTNLTLCANFYLYNGMLLLHRWYWMPQSHTWQLLASTFRELWGLVVVLLWGKNRGKWKGWQLPEVESRTPQAWAASALPLSHSAYMQHAKVSTWSRQWQRAKMSPEHPTSTQMIFACMILNTLSIPHRKSSDPSLTLELNSGRSM